MGSQSYEGLLKRQQHLVRRMTALLRVQQADGFIDLQQVQAQLRLLEIWQRLNERVRAHEILAAHEVRVEARLAKIFAEE